MRPVLTPRSSGCRAGNQCRFLHPVETVAPEETPQKTPDQPPTGSSIPLHQRSEDKPTSNASRVVARPVPKAQTDNPRAFQIRQMQRRFQAELSEQGEFTLLKFEMQPSDPDFPYEIESLECVMSVPGSYPVAGKPTLVVRNKDIPRGFQINIERGFDTIAAAAPGVTLLALMNRLDKQLETILAGRIAETVKIVPNASQPKKTIPKEDRQSQEVKQATAPTKSASTDITDEQKADALKTRQAHVRQLEARFSRLQSFAKSADGLSFTLPLDSPKRPAWPTPLQSLRTARITIPAMYPLSPAELHLDSESAEARLVEEAFNRRSKEDPGATLTQRMNYLSQNLKEMSIAPKEEQNVTQIDNTAPQRQVLPVSEVPPSTRPESGDQRPHLHYIPRPPEWDHGTGVDDGTDSEGTASTFESGSSDEEGEEEFTQPPDESSPSGPAERGILLSFPHLELHGIELLELTSLNITVKCERCKDLMDIERLRTSSEDAKARETSCKKCANGMAIRFRADMIHANSVRGGYLDLDGCTVVDMLPSNFIPTCSECSTSYPAPGIAAVRGDSAIAICRECHRRMSLRIQEVKFLLVSAAAIRASRAPGRKKQRENLGITAGTELPQRGRCIHYKKSYRWFRFSCCNKVFPCDRCHDDQTDHPNEFANRMLCGFCSREQNYRPDNCGICHSALTGKRGAGFWEGGKGTRDPMKMSRKDPRKYKRRPGTKPKT